MCFIKAGITRVMGIFPRFFFLFQRSLCEDTKMYVERRYCLFFMLKDFPPFYAIIYSRGNFDYRWTHVWWREKGKGSESWKFIKMSKIGNQRYLFRLKCKMKIFISRNRDSLISDFFLFFSNNGLSFQFEMIFFFFWRIPTIYPP